MLMLRLEGNEGALLWCIMGCRKNSGRGADTVTEMHS